MKFCLKLIRKQFETWLSAIKEVQTNLNLFLTGQIRRLHGSMAFTMDSEVEFRMEWFWQSILWEQRELKSLGCFFLGTKPLETSFDGVVELTRLNSYHMLLEFNKFLQLMKVFFFLFSLPPAVCCSGWWRPASLPRSSWTWPFWTRRERLGYRQLSGWTQVVQWPIRNNI